MRKTWMGLGFLVVLGGPAAAQEASEHGRYEMQPVEGGVARMDTQTGAVSFCRTTGEGGLSCSLADDERRSFEERITDLQRQLAARPVITGSQATRPPVTEDDAEFDKALDRMKQAFRAFGEIAREFDRPAEPKDGPAPHRT